MTENTQPAQEGLATRLNGITFLNLATPSVTNVDAQAVNLGTEARPALVRQVSLAVRWLESVEFLISQGVQSLIEIGPGKVLSGLVRQIDRNLRCRNVEDKASLGATREALGVSG